MKPSKTIENHRLAKVDALITRLSGEKSSDQTELRLQLLEATASRIGGFELREYQALFGICSLIRPEKLVHKARSIVLALEETGIHPALCLSALARESCDHDFRRSNGIYHTDFRLALHLAHSIEGKIAPHVRVIDPACGAGMLLSAVSIIACGNDRIMANNWLRHSIYAADLSLSALRGTLLSLSALTDDLDALADMRSKWIVQDSLLAPERVWSSVATGGFDIVVANPPWEKLKLTRHEYIKAKGGVRFYGTNYEGQSLSGYKIERSKRAKLAIKLAKKYPSLLKAEPDLYVAFTELLLKLTRQGGSGALLVPAGLIRSKNTLSLRSDLICSSEDISYTIMDNRARYFAIDTRFKFVLVNYKRSSNHAKPAKNIGVIHAWANKDKVIVSPQVKLPINTLRKLRPDLTVPEVRNYTEWRLFKKMQAKGLSLDKETSPWFPVFCREVDMTRDRPNFVRSRQSNFLPVIEGRMVQPHRIGCKSYLSGEGRSAKWKNLPPGQSDITPQFWIPIESISRNAQERVERNRAGFCDITGQTNERSMMAALIPENVVCGNKVPTVEFPNDPSEARLFLWLSIVNSLPFDWLLRRVITTTVNYFVILSVRLPSIDIGSLPAQRTNCDKPTAC